MIIYKATNKINNKSYVGQTINSLARRMTEHKYRSKRVKHKSKFYNAINKYGFNIFEWTTLCECDTRDELDEMEYHYIMQYDAYSNGYNLSLGGERGPMLIGELNPMYGKKRSDMVGDLNPAKRPEVRKKISKSNKGRIISEASKDATRKRLTGKTFEELYGDEKAKEIRERFKNRKTKSVLSCTLLSPDGEVITATIKEMCENYGMKWGSVHDLFSGRNKSGKHRGWTRL